MTIWLQNIAKWALVGVLSLSICHCSGGGSPAPSSDSTLDAASTATTSTPADPDAGDTTGEGNTTPTPDETTAQTDPNAIGLTAADWDVVSNGEGTVTFDADGILMTPKAATASSETHGAWLLTKLTETTPLQNFKATITFTNVAQLRTGSAANPWEVFWLFFNYTLGSDGKKQTNYVVIKTNGTEMGRAYSETSQEFLVTNSSPSLAIGTEHTIVVTKNATHVTVTLDDAAAADFTSEAAPSSKYIYDEAGSIGLYTEDAQVRVSSVTIEPLP